VISLTLAELSAAVGGTLRLAPGSHDFDDVSGSVQTDSRLVTSGSIFIALPGEVSDGHLFAQAAIDNGAALLLVDHELELPLSQVVVEDTLTALADLARFVVASVRAQGDLKVIGITGSNGKTTTKNMLRAVLETAGATIAPPGSFNNQVGAPLSMLSIELDTRFLVIEMGAAGIGEIARTVGIAVPDISVVLKVGLAHAGEFGGIEQTQRAKSEIVTELPADAVAVLNIDDERVAAMAALTRARPVWFGLDDAADVRADDLRATASGNARGRTRTRCRSRDRYHGFGIGAACGALAHGGAFRAGWRRGHQRCLQRQPRLDVGCAQDSRPDHRTGPAFDRDPR